MGTTRFDLVYEACVMLFPPRVHFVGVLLPRLRREIGARSRLANNEERVFEMKWTSRPELDHVGCSGVDRTGVEVRDVCHPHPLRALIGGHGHLLERDRRRRSRRSRTLGRRRFARRSASLARRRGSLTCELTGGGVAASVVIGRAIVVSIVLRFGGGLPHIVAEVPVEMPAHHELHAFGVSGAEGRGRDPVRPLTANHIGLERMDRARLVH